MARAPLSLKARAIGLLAQREHSRSELRRKLLRIRQQQRQKAERAAAFAASEGEALAPSGLGEHDDADEGEGDGAAVDALLDALATDGYLDETRFVESRLHVRAARFGAQRIRQELARHGLKLDAGQQAALRDSEFERARTVWLKRYGAAPSTEPAERARQARFLLARGFAPDLVRRLLRT